MGLLDLLGLPAATLALAQNKTALQPPPPAQPSPGAKAKAKGKAIKGVTAGDDEMTAVSSPPLGWIGSNGRERQVFGFTDPSGTLVRGGSTQPMRALSELNAYAMRGVELVMEMQRLEDAWREEVARVRYAADAGAAKLDALEKVVPAMTERMGKDSDFFQKVNAYIAALDDASLYPDMIATQGHALDEKQKLFEAVVLDKQRSEAEGEVATAAAAVAAEEEQIKEATEIFKVVFELGQKVMEAKWGDIAEKALEFASEKTFGVAMSLDLERLKGELGKAKARVSRIANKAYVARIEAARSAFEVEAGRMKTLQDKFAIARDQVAAQQANAQNELGDSKTTAVVGEMIGMRAKQVAALARAKSSCGVYARVADKGKAKVSKIGEIFGRIGSFLDEAAKADPAFDRSKPYATSIENSARGNADVFYSWIDTIAVSKAECQKAIDWLATTGEKSPLGSYQTVLEITKKGISQARG